MGHFSNIFYNLHFFQCNDTRIDTIVNVVGVFVSLVLVLTTILLSKSTTKVSKDKLKSEAYSLVNVWKFVSGEDLNWGSHLLDEKDVKRRIEKLQRERMVFFFKSVKDTNIIKKIKIIKLELDNFSETENYFKFNHFNGKNNDIAGFESTEYLSYIDNKTAKVNNAYRIAMIFYSKNIDKFLDYLNNERLMIKMDIELINHMNVKTKCKISFIFKKVKDKNNNEYWETEGYNYFNNIEINY